MTDVSRLIGLCFDKENGPGTQAFPELFAAEMAKMRRESYGRLGLVPVPVNGSDAQGLAAGYFARRLEDGSLGYLQRRSDDCLQAALASCLQIPMPEVPDLRLAQKVAAGNDLEEIDRGISGELKRFAERYGVTAALHTSRFPTTGRWIALESDPRPYSDHCYVMKGRECLFDASSGAPPLKELKIDYGISLKRR